jgi:hypothetical protein
LDKYLVRDLKVPRHLGLLDRTFVPHNLISAQEGPVHLPKFQMAPRLKILISSGYKEGTQIYMACPNESGTDKFMQKFI